ncbi:MAG: STAS domain-containing protein [Armatimonadetes bacterium]|nr:STAS domain-containing protein [Armatimonadota bacterium]
MEIVVTQSKPNVVKVAGEVDLTTSAKFRAALDHAVSESPDGVIVDLSDVTYLDSTGIHTILVVYRRLQDQGGRLSLVVERPNVKKVLEILHMDRLAGLEICGDVISAEQAVAAIGN